MNESSSITVVLMKPRPLRHRLEKAVKLLPIVLTLPVHQNPLAINEAVPEKAYRLTEQ